MTWQMMCRSKEIEMKKILAIALFILSSTAMADVWVMKKNLDFNRILIIFALEHLYENI